MNSIIKPTLYWAIITAIVVFAVVTIWSLFVLQFPADPALRLEYMKFVLEIYKAVGIGFLIAILGIIIPHVLPEAKYLFEQSKEARVAYSKAKTGVEYLPYELAGMEYESAMGRIKSVHQEKHLAETYGENKSNEELYKRLKEDFYYALKDYRQVVGEHGERWNSLPRNERLQLLLISKNSVPREDVR